MKEIIPEEGEIIKYGEIGEKERRNKDIFIAAVVMLTGFLGFGLGRLSKIDAMKEPVTIEYPDTGGQESAFTGGTSQADLAAATVGKRVASAHSPTGFGASSSPIVASRNGTKYYFTWCTGASRIAEKNRVYFATAALAEVKGLSKAANCPGL